MVRADVPVEGALAFRAGEEVYVMKVDPDPSRPEYRYVVRSNTLQDFFVLRSVDLAPLMTQASVPVRPVERLGSRADNIPGFILLAAGLGMILAGPLPWYKGFGVSHTDPLLIFLSMASGVFVTFRAIEVLYVLPRSPERKSTRPLALIFSCAALVAAVYLIYTGKHQGYALAVSPYLFLGSSLVAVAASIALLRNAPGGGRGG